MNIMTIMRCTKILTHLPHPAFRLMTTTLATSLAASALAQTPAVKSGDSIAFMGDSITQGGWENPVGYVRLVMSGLEANGIQAKAIPAGISGHKSNNMLERLRRDVLDKKPTWMTLSCGVNDVWHGANGVPLPQYKTNITAIIEQAQAAGIKVMVLTATVITEQQDNPNNQKLAAYNEFLRALAKEKGCLLADLNADMWAGLKDVVRERERIHQRWGAHERAGGLSHGHGCAPCLWSYRTPDPQSQRGVAVYSETALEGQKVNDERVDLGGGEVRGAAVPVRGIAVHKHLAHGGGGAVVEVGGGPPHLHQGRGVKGVAGFVGLVLGADVVMLQVGVEAMRVTVRSSRSPGCRRSSRRP